MWEDAKTTSVKDGPEIPVNVAVMCEVIKKVSTLVAKAGKVKFPREGCWYDKIKTIFTIFGVKEGGGDEDDGIA